MVITLTGENGFGLQAALQQRIGAFLAQFDELALERVDGQEADYPRIREALTGLPFLSAKKLVVLRTPGVNKTFVEKIEQVFAEIPESSDVIIVEPKLDKRTAYYKLLKKQTDFLEFAELDPSALGRWLVDVAKSKGGMLSIADARYLVDRVGAEQQLLAQELDKLLLYDAHISHNSITVLTEATPQSTVFQLLEAAFARNIQQAMRLYQEQRALKVEPQQIIAMIAWQLHILALVKTASGRGVEAIAKEARLNPFVVRKSQAIARNMSLAQIRRLIEQLTKLDQRTKVGALDIDEGLRFYLLTVAY